VSGNWNTKQTKTKSKDNIGGFTCKTFSINQMISSYIFFITLSIYTHHFDLKKISLLPMNNIHNFQWATNLLKFPIANGEFLWIYYKWMWNCLLLEFKLNIKNIKSMIKLSHLNSY